MTRHSPRSDDFGTALVQTLPWLLTIDNLVAAARALVEGTGSKADLDQRGAELAQRLAEYDAAAAKVTETT